MIHSIKYLSIVFGILLAWTVFAVLSPNSPERLPQSLGASTEGYYSLVNGTDSCPRKVEWTAECDGFVLVVLENGKEKDHHQFCKINKGLQALQEKTSFGFRKSLVRTEHKENLYSKVTTVILQDSRHSIQLKQSDTIIFDAEPRFLWEHSQDDRGFSCLYAK